MIENNRLPSRKETFTAIGIGIVFLFLTATLVGLRLEHILMCSLFMLLFFISPSTRKLAVALMPFILFGISYDYMRIYPNYQLNPIDTKDLYNLEKSLFGINENGAIITPCEYFSIHHCATADILAGLFYLCWVPVPIAFGLWLYFKDKYLYLKYSMVFLFVNLIGFAGYYIHPAAPPWYVINYGFTPIINTPGNVGGLGRFDQLIGLPIFHSIYGRNANVFAAIPSLHAAYMLITLIYAIMKRCNVAIITLFAIIMVGIWCTAVYASHHYIIDVSLGILCALVGVLIFEKGFLKLNFFKNFVSNYYDYIK